MSYKYTPAQLDYIEDVLDLSAALMTEAQHREFQALWAAMKPAKAATPIDPALKAHRATAKKFGGKALTGTAKQKLWAESLRAEVLGSVSEAEALALCKYHVFSNAKFWIESRGIAADKIGAVGLMTGFAIDTANAIAAEYKKSGKAACYDAVARSLADAVNAAADGFFTQILAIDIQSATVYLQELQQPAPPAPPSITVAQPAAAPAEAAPVAVVVPPATPIATVRAALTQAYGKLADQLEQRGLVTVVQTQEQAIEAAAKARAAKTGESVEQAKRSLVASVKNSVAPQTESENFKRWFGKSKVVDASGSPLVVYHGTDAEINAFDLDLAGTGAWGRVSSGASNGSGANSAIYLTSSKGHAESYGDTQMPLYVSIQNPLVVSAKDVLDRWLEDEMPEYSTAQEMVDGYYDGQVYDALGADVFFNDRIREAQEANRDGVIVDFGDLRMNGRTEVGKVVIAFTPTQIKSSSDNNGNFDPNDPDIHRSADGNVQGFFDPQTGQAFLVADHLTAEAAPGVLMHEVGIHMAADKMLAPLFNRAKMLLKAQRSNAFMQRVQAKMDAAGETSGEEVAAYMVEAYESDRTAAPASVGKWPSDLLANVKAWMHRNGIIGADSLTVADIAAVARANAKSLAQGQDRHIDTKRTQQAITKSSGPIVDGMNVRQRE